MNEYRIRTLLFAGALLLGPALFAGCGDDDGGSGTAADAGGGSDTPAPTDTGGTSDDGQTSEDGGPGPTDTGGEPTPCGGLAGETCAAGQYCHWDEAGICGADDGPGVCKAKPQGCGGVYAPVCGCDGAVYGNPCEANASGTSVGPAGSCGCGGLAGLPCPTGDFCDLPTGSCGLDDSSGACASTTELPCAGGTPVCGCNGQTYSSDCERMAAGVSKKSDGACDGIPPGKCRTDTDCDANGGSYCLPFGAPLGCGVCFEAENPCNSDAECKAADPTSICAPSTVQDCLCEPGNLCKPGCVANTDCALGETCDTQTNHCLPSSCTDADLPCPPNFTCTSEASTCMRTTCTGDDACDDFCVLGACYVELGSCEFPVP